MEVDGDGKALVTEERLVVPFGAMFHFHVMANENAAELSGSFMLVLSLVSPIFFCRNQNTELVHRIAQ